MLIRLRGYAGWSAPLLFAYGKSRFSHDVAHLILFKEFTLNIPWKKLYWIKTLINSDLYFIVFIIIMIIIIIIIIKYNNNSNKNNSNKKKNNCHYYYYYYYYYCCYYYYYSIILNNNNSNYYYYSNRVTVVYIKQKFGRRFSRNFL